jgi:predicted XRE-type DNA-binding protein
LNIGIIYLTIFRGNSVNYEEVMAQNDVDSDTNTELRVKLFEAKTELEKSQKEINKLKLELAKSQSMLKTYELKIAEIISGDTSGVEINETLLKELMAFRKESAVTLQQFEDLYKYMVESYKLLKADKTVEETFKIKAALVREKISSLLTQSKAKQSESGMVLDINTQLNVVAINLGFSDGVSQGSEWQVSEDNTVVASLKIIEVRKSLSIGILTEGKIQDVLQGATVVKRNKN